MASVVYNLNNLRAPLTGIGRYALELVKQSVVANQTVSVVANDQLIRSSNLSSVFQQLESTTIDSARPLRQIVGGLPFVRSLYRARQNQKFCRLAAKALSGSEIYHDLQYAPCSAALRSVSTVYDLSHIHAGATHPSHRVRFLRRAFKRLQKSSDAIITISENVKSELLDEYNIHSDRVFVTHLAADPVFKPRDQKECQSTLDRYSLFFEQYALCVSTLEPRKNFARIVQAYAALPCEVQKQFPLAIAGDKGWKSADLEKQLSSLQAQGLIRRLGFVPQTDLPILYSGAAVFLYPSLYEGFGLPLLEAMQSGCPCITSNTGALAEVCDDAAVQIDPYNIDGLAEQTSRLLQDDSLAAHYSAAGIRRATKFSWAETARKTWQVYETI